MDRTPEEFTWTAHPARERIGMAVSAAIVIVAVAAAVYVSFASLPWSLVSLLVLIFSLSHFYFPSHFAINHEGITARYLFSHRQYRWKNIRRFLHDQHGGHLSTSKRPSRLDAFRGLNIVFGKNRAAVIQQIRIHMQQVEQQ